jgi:hypothetical protein
VEATGELVVVARPWGRVRVDGVDVGPTPLRRRFPVGVHEVEVWAADRDELRLRQSTTVEADREVTVRVVAP